MGIWKNLLATALVWGSFLLSHELAYRVAYPDAAQRAHELSHSGHGWLATTVHFGLPAIAAILLVGLFSRRSQISRQSPLIFAGSTAGLFATVEILERIMAASSATSHGFAVEPVVMMSGLMFSAVLGALVSSIYFTLQSFVINHLLTYQTLPVPPFAVGLSLSRAFSEISAKLKSRIIISSPLRGPPPYAHSVA